MTLRHYVIFAASALLWLGNNGLIQADDASKASPAITIEGLLSRFRQPVDTIRFDDVPLPEAIGQIAARFQLPLVIEDSVGKLSPMPKLNLTVSNITVIQLLDVVGTCTGTTRWIDPPNYSRQTPLKLYWVTRRRGREFTDQRTWKTVAVQQSERIVSALSERTVIEFADTPLEDALDFLRDFHQVSVEYAGPPEKLRSPITLDAKDVTLMQAFEKMLGPLELGYVLDNHAIRIVSQEEARKRSTTRIYALPNWTGNQADGRILESAIIRIVGEGVLKVEPHVVWLGSCISVTAAEEQHKLVDQFVAEFRNVDEVLVPKEYLPHAPGRLPNE